MFEKGLLNKDQLQRKYGIGKNSRILSGCRKNGKYAYPQNQSWSHPMKNPQRPGIKELEAKLKAAVQKLKVCDKLIEISNRKLDQDIIKKSKPGCPGLGNTKEYQRLFVGIQSLWENSTKRKNK